MESENKVDKMLGGKKKNRCQNWVDEEKKLLTSLVRARVKEIENKNTDTNTNKKKKEAWQQIFKSFNELGKGPHRTASQLKTQWGVIKMTAKKKRSSEMKSIMKTGGGSKSPVESIKGEDIENWLAPEFVVDTNEFDCDSYTREMHSYVKKPKEQDLVMVVEEIQEEIAAPVFLIDESVEEEAQEEVIETPVDDNNVKEGTTAEHAVTPQKRIKKSKRKLRQPQTGLDTTSVTERAKIHMENLVTQDIKNKDELHQLKIENEKLKREVLLYKRDYWRIKCMSIGGNIFTVEDPQDS